MENKQNIDPYSPGGCFIATACMGSDSAKEVLLLKEFRDLILKNNILGKMSVKTYYTISPPIAKFISKRQNTKKVVKKIIVEPAYKVSKMILRK